MLCDNLLCIYEKEHHCLLNRIDLDEEGRCRQCIMIAWTEEELQAKKERIRHSLST